MKTTNYQQFKYFNWNRPVTESWASKISKSISEFGYLKAREVIVTPDMYIIDGQHRVRACEILKIPVPYVISDTPDAQREAIALNNSQNIWRLNNWVHTWAETGKKEYIIIREFEDKYKLGISNSIEMCVAGSRSTGTLSNIKAGKRITLNPNRERLAEFVLMCKDVPFNKTSFFVRACKDLINKCDDNAIAKVFKNRLAIPKQAGEAGYKVVFENIINKNKNTSKYIKL